MKYIKGMILTSKGLKKGYITIKGSTIVEMHFTTCPKPPDYVGLICPTFIDMHTHIGDAFIAEKNIPLPHDIIKLVAPPDGLKHKLLQSSNDEEIIHGMRQAIQKMMVYGTHCFVDFRENGEPGINLITKALQDFSINSSILSRPQSLEYDRNEICSLLKKSDGIGLSSLTDWEYDDITQIANETKKMKKIFALHVSERIREDIHKIIRLEPDFIIHMTKATKKDLELVKKHQIPIVICPRSNSFFNLIPPLTLFKEIENTLLIGSDNSMLHSPNVIEELHQINRIRPGLFTLEELLSMVTYQPRKVLNSKDDMHVELFSPSSYVILNERTLQPIVNKIMIRDGCYES